ncbi:hypothetical protein ACFL27_05260, partial [candidate division CSSED10-310 bacterium]
PDPNLPPTETETVQSDIEMMIDQARAEASDVQEQDDLQTESAGQDLLQKALEDIPTTADDHFSFPAAKTAEDPRKKPYLLGFFDLPQQGSLLLKEKSDGENYSLEVVPASQASFKIVFSDNDPKFFVSKKCPFSKPSPFQQTEWGAWESTVKNNDYFYLENIKSDGAPVSATKSAAAQSTDPDDEPYYQMSMAELSQALLDGLIDIDKYNKIVAAKNVAQQSTQIMEDPDVVLEEGVNYCADWAGKITSSNAEEANLRITIRGSKFHLELKERTSWKTLYKDEEIPQTGFNGSFSRLLIFKEPSNKPDIKEITRRINKEYSFLIIRLISETYGIKFY